MAGGRVCEGACPAGPYPRHNCSSASSSSTARQASQTHPHALERWQSYFIPVTHSAHGSIFLKDLCPFGHLVNSSSTFRTLHMQVLVWVTSLGQILIPAKPVLGLDGCSSPVTTPRPEGAAQMEILHPCVNGTQLLLECVCAHTGSFTSVLPAAQVQSISLEAGDLAVAGPLCPW